MTPPTNFRVKRPSYPATMPLGMERVFQAELTAGEIEKLRIKLRSKVRYHIGAFCPDVDDIVQETLMRFLRAQQGGRIQKPESIGSYVNGICKNIIFEYRRRLWREPAEDPEVLENTLSCRPVAEQFEIPDSVRAVLARMSDRDRDVLRLFFLDGKTSEEICAETGISDASFRVVLFRAKQRFRKIFCQDLKLTALIGH